MKKIIITENNKMDWKNVSGTSERSPKCKCGSWKQHWLNYSDTKWPERCCVLGCEKSAVLGAHVRRKQSSKEFIAPFCDTHNHLDVFLTLQKDTILVNANQSETCN